MEAAEAEVAAIAGGRGGHLRIASFPTAGATLMPLGIAAFSASHPAVDVTLAEGEPEEIAARLRAGEFDLALLFEFPGVGEKPAAGMRRFELLDDPLHLALRKDHPLAKRRELRLEDLREESSGADLGEQPLRRPRRPLMPCRRVRAQRLLRKRRLPDRPGAGGGRGRGGADPQLALSTVRDDIRIRALHPHSPVRKVFAATRRGAPVTPAVATMLDVLREESRRRPAKAV